ncbi:MULTISPECIES: hypothetical protein [unclassified Arthrobacter]|uniref:hypothetical protein n=1 Tax=unclassified Arthrobacter TaxID=235627 RepID=UPI0022272704|nr:MULTISPECIES: hypothetical protein [unclassified Arthrobacter]UYY81613.1 hypothetical protein OIT41_00600 [Arthrobacter sp. YA7-1]
MVNKGKQPPRARTSPPAKSAARTASDSGSANGGRPQRRRTSPAVYRRRRLVVFGALLTVLAMLVAGVAAMSSTLASKADSGASNPQAVGATPASQTPSADPIAATTTPTPTPVCDLNLVTVTASTDQPAYAAGQNPVLSMKITNGGAAPCQVNVGTSQMEFLVMSGEDRIFSSKDCQAKGDDLVKQIDPGKSETANFPWQRNRTTEGCGVISAKPATGTYTFKAILGNKASTKTVFQLG